MNDRSEWRDYLAAAQSLDALCRAHVSATAVATRTASAARAELTKLHTELARQHAALTTEAARSGIPAPALAPSPIEQATAAPLASDLDAVPDALRHCQQLLATANAQLAGEHRRRWWIPRRRRG